MSVKVLLKHHCTDRGFQLKSALVELRIISISIKGMNALLKAPGKARIIANEISER